MRGYLSIFKLAATALAFLSLALPQDELAKLYSEAQQAQTAGDLATASRKYEAIVQLRPQMAEAYANLGNLYYQQGQSDRAKPAYEKAIHIKPDLAQKRLQLRDPPMPDQLPERDDDGIRLGLEPEQSPRLLDEFSRNVQRGPHMIHRNSYA